MSEQIYVVSNGSEEVALFAPLIKVIGDFNSDGVFIDDEGRTWKYAVPLDVDKGEDRKIVLLRAAYDLLKKHPIAQECLVFYDDAECDGMCLMEDIANELDIEL